VSLTDAQKAAQKVLSGDATHIMLEGGSRSGKTFLLTRAVSFRAIKAADSRHCILRYRFNHIKASIIMDTFPKVMSVCYPDVEYDLNKTDWFAKFPNGAEIWFGGLDDKARTEKILGLEFATIYLNEISQIGFDARNIAVTRLAQKVWQEVSGVKRLLPVRMYYDLNPTSKGHWGYKLFHESRDPETKQAIKDPQDYAFFRINPEDNLTNISDSYLKVLDGMSARQQRRFLRGEWSDENPNALFSEVDIDKWRVIDGRVPELIRVLVSVDPSGSGDTDNADNDAIGIMVGGLGIDGRAYILEDLTVKAGPATWGRIATSAYDRHQAGAVIGESNFGGEMVRFVIQTARPRTPYREVHASRGKTVRAEPFSALYENGKVCHVGFFPELEDELTAFSTVGYMGTRSPNRADALIWLLTELFPGMTKPGEEPEPNDDEFPGMPAAHNSWMA
jgi:phage terminase large subunit-like protein